ncbi:cupin domain-containing protein [Pseudoalteromonas gelatinilytica]
MMKLMLVSLLSTTLFGTGVAVGKSADPAHIASPNQYEVLHENEEVLVLKMTLKPNEQDNWHKHNAETVYFEKGGKATITTAEKDMTLEIPNGYVMWHDQWEHQVKNVGDTTITAIIVEKK